MDTKDGKVFSAFSPRAAIAAGWQKATTNLWGFFLIMAVNWAVSAFLNGLSGAVRDRGFLSFAVSMVGWAVLTVLQMGLVRVSLAVLDGGAIRAKDFTTTGPEFLKFLGASILVALVVVAGFIAFIIPGIILGLRLQFYQYLVLEKGLRPTEALKQSWQMTRGQTLDLFILMVALIAIVIIGALLLGVGLLLALPLAAVASAFAYRKLENAIPSASPVLPLAAPVE